MTACNFTHETMGPGLHRFRVPLSIPTRPDALLAVGLRREPGGSVGVQLRRRPREPVVLAQAVHPHRGLPAAGPEEWARRTPSGSLVAFAAWRLEHHRAHTTDAVTRAQYRREVRAYLHEAHMRGLDVRDVLTREAPRSHRPTPITGGQDALSQYVLACDAYLHDPTPENARRLDEARTRAVNREVMQ